MARPGFDAALIGDLRRRVIEHNDAGGERVKLGGLKKIYERNFGGEQPAAHAMAAVDAHLSAMSKASQGGEFEEAEHPRGQAGKFSSKGGSSSAGRTAQMKFPMPHTQEEHAALQESNPAYRAMTTQIIPTHLNEGNGWVAREAGSALIAAGAVTSLLRRRGGRTGALAWLGRHAGGFAGKTAGVMGGAAIAAAPRAADAAMAALARAAGKKTRHFYGGADFMRTVRAAADFGTARGARAGENLAHGVGAVARLPAGAAEGIGVAAAQRGAFRATYRMAEAVGKFKRGQSDAVRQAASFAMARKVGRAAGSARRGVNRGLVGAALAVPVYAGVRNLPGIADLPQLGASYDNLSYREVQKLAADPALDGVAQAIREELRKTGGGDGLAKGFASKFFGRGFTTLATAGAAAVGGALGSTAGRAVAPSGSEKHGNPYHDNHGRFTSRGQAYSTVGGALGALAAGAAAFSLIRRGNARALANIAVHLHDRNSVRLAAIGSEKGFGRVADMIRNRPLLESKLVQEEADKPSSKLNQVLREISDRGASHVAHYQTALKSEFDRALGDQLRGQADIVTPSGMSISSMIESAPRSVVEKAVAKLPKKHQERVLSLYDGRAAALANVPGHLAEHHGAIDAAKAAIKPANDHLEAAEKAKDAANAAVAALPEGVDGKRAIAAAKKAEKAHVAANDAVVAAEKAHQDLIGSPPPVLNPLNGKPIPVPDARATAWLKDNARGDARMRAAKKVSENIEAARKDQVAGAANRSSRLMAAYLMAADRAPGAVPSRLAGVMKDLRPVLARHHAAGRAVVDSEAKHVLAKDALDRFDAAAAVLARRAPKAGKKVATATIKAAEQERMRATLSIERLGGVDARKGLQEAVDKAETKLHGAHKDYVAARSAADAHAALFTEHYNARHPNERALLPLHLLTGLKDDVAHGARRAAKPLRDLLQSKSGKAFIAWAQDLGAKGAAGAKVQAGRLGSGLKVAGKQMFLDKEGDLHPGKVMMWLGSGSLGGAALEAAREHYSNLSAMWDGRERKPSDRPKSHTETRFDPLTGAGHAILTAPDPTNKDDRVILWGQTYGAHGEGAKHVFAGSKLSDFRRRMQQEQERRQQQNQPAQGGQQGQPGQQQSRGPNPLDTPLQPHAEEFKAARTEMQQGGKVFTVRAGENGPSANYRREDDSGQAAHKASNTFGGTFNTAVIGKGATKGEAYHGALTALFSHHGQVNKPTDAYKLLTGYRASGPRKGEKFGQGGAFADNVDFGSDDKGKVLGALKGEVGRALREAPAPSGHNKANLKNAVALVAHVKGLSNSEINPLLAQIDSAQGGAEQPKPVEQPKPAEPPRQGGQTPHVPTASGLAAALAGERAGAQKAMAEMGRARPQAATIERPKFDPENAHAVMPHHWDGAKLAQRLSQSAGAVADALSTPESPVNPRDVIHAMRPMAVMVGNAYSGHHLTEDQAVRAVSAAIRDSATGDPENRDETYSELGNPRFFISHLHAAVTKDLTKSGSEAGALRKWAGLRKAQFPVGDIPLGEKAKSYGEMALGDVAEAGGRIAVRGLGPRQRSFVEPRRLGSEVGSNLLSNLAWEAADHFLPEVGAASKAVSVGAQLLRGTAKAGRFGAQAGGSIAAGAAGLAGGDALGRAAYAATGRKAPGAYEGPRYASVGDGLSDAAGNIGGTWAGAEAGAAIGGAFGGVGAIPGATVGAVLGATLGGVAGGPIGRTLYAGGHRIAQWFQGYHAPAVQRSMGHVAAAGQGAAAPGGRFSQ